MAKFTSLSIQLKANKLNKIRFSIRRSALQAKVYNTTTLNVVLMLYLCQAFAIQLPMDVYRLQDLQTVG